MAAGFVLRPLLGVLLALGAQFGSVAAATYKVKTGHFYVDTDYICGGKTTKIFYPVGKGKFPVVVYAHGMGNGLENCDSALKTVAKYGLTVIAPVTGGESDTCNSDTEYQDLLHALHVAKSKGYKQHHMLSSKYADWSNIGVWGWSMGGKTSSRVVQHAAHYGLKIGAVTMSHGARHSDVVVGVPSLYITGTLDTEVSSPPQVMYAEYANNPSAHKVFVNLIGGEHTEPCDEGKGRLNPWVGKFFRCHLAGKWCKEVYGKGTGSLCAANKYANCILHQPASRRRRTATRRRRSAVTRRRRSIRRRTSRRRRTATRRRRSAVTRRRRSIRRRTSRRRASRRRAARRRTVRRRTAPRRRRTTTRRRRTTRRRTATSPLAKAENQLGQLQMGSRNRTRDAVEILTSAADEELHSQEAGGLQAPAPPVLV